MVLIPPSFFFHLCFKTVLLNYLFTVHLNWKQAQKKIKNCSKKIRKGEKGKAKKLKEKKTKKLEIWISASAQQKCHKLQCE